LVLPLVLFRRERQGPFREFLKRRFERGPVLKRLRDMFFEASTEILDPDQLIIRLRDDLRECEDHMVILSPFLNMNAVRKFVSLKEMKAAMDRGVRITVVTRPPKKGEIYEKSIKEHEKCIEYLKSSGLKVVERAKFHFKTVIVDAKIIYIGSINPLSVITITYVPADYMLRFVSEALVDEIVDKTISREEYEKYLE